MRGKHRCIGASLLAVAAAAIPAGAQAQQKSAENAVTSADDAFGTSVGLESTGIYSESLARGFSPIQAGNVRLDGIYFDPVSLVSFRILESQAIRIGYAALDYPFPAPTGIVDDRLRSAGDDWSLGLGIHKQQYGSFVTEADIRIPIVKGHLSLLTGLSQGAARHIDGATGQNYSFVVKPVIRWRGLEVSPFYSGNHLRDNEARPLIIAAGGFIPKLPPAKRYYGAFWAKGSFENMNHGVTLKARITDRLSLRAGLFRSSIRREANYTETFIVADHSGLAAHRVIADPLQDLHSWSGEAQVAYRFGSATAQHRVIAGFRGRDRYTEFGGSDDLSDVRHFPEVSVEESLAVPKPDFNFSPVNRGKIRQTAWLLGYLGKIDGLGQLNLGLQRADFRGRTIDAVETTSTREKHWLYNASVAVELARDLMLFSGTQRGLEDSGAAPENASNRNEQLPPRRSTQYEAGLRWRLPTGQVLVSVFEISKPYFSFDAANRFTRLGTVRHRGVEASISGRFFKRLNLLAGAVAMKPRVTGPGIALGLVGKRPVGTRPVRIRVDANYRTDIWRGLTATLSVTHQSRTAASARPLSPQSGRQLMLPSTTTVDVGFRQPLKLGGFPATLRGKVENLFDQRSWNIIASNTLQPADHRRFSLSLLVDF